MAERPEGLALEVAVGPAGHVVALEIGKVEVGSIEGDGELSGRVIVARKYLRDRGAGTLAAVPGLHYGSALAALLRKSHRGT